MCMSYIHKKAKHEKMISKILMEIILEYQSGKISVFITSFL